MWLFKTVGLFLIFFASCTVGFLKSNTIKARTEGLRKISKSLTELGQRIRLCQGELGELLLVCFEEMPIKTGDKGFFITQGQLSPKDADLLNEFLKDAGMGDISAEYNRTVSYAKLFENRYNSAKQESDSLCRLYKSLGVLCGIFICIFFL